MSKYRITLEGKTYEMEIELVSEESTPRAVEKKAYKEFRGESKDPTVNVIDPSVRKQTVNDKGTVAAPMPGTVLRILKGAGEIVKAGELVLVLEAMKMENEILAPSDGTIMQMSCQVGSTVAGGDVLFEVK